jgi:hypothetical protein
MSYTKPIGVAYEDQDLDDAIIGKAPAAGGRVGFYGTTPATQRAAAAQATSLVGTASATAVDTNLKAAIIEIMNTLQAIGLWKGAA